MWWARARRATPTSAKPKQEKQTTRICLQYGYTMPEISLSKNQRKMGKKTKPPTTETAVWKPANVLRATYLCTQASSPLGNPLQISHLQSISDFFHNTTLHDMYGI